MAVVNKIDSNVTEVRYAQETSLGVLPAAASQVWKSLEPNTYKDWGGRVTTVARNPINSGRQRKKGVTTDQEASGGISQDITQTNLQDLLQGFFFADLRKKAEFTGTVTSVDTTDDSFNAASGLSIFRAGDLIKASGFNNATNNALHRVVTAAAGKITVGTNLVSETPPVTGTSLVAVGFQFNTGDAQIVVSGSTVTLTAAAKDLTQLGLIPGEWVFLGGDTAVTQFANAANRGFARVRSVTATTMTFDKTSNTFATDNGAAKTIQLFVGRVLKNETGTLVKRRTYTLERILGYNNDSDITKQQADYLIGSIANEFALNVATADKVMVDISFQSLRAETKDENVLGANTLLSKVASVTRETLVEADAFNSSTDVTRMRLAVVDPTNINPTPLFAFVEELTLTINNNLTPNKAIGVNGAFEVTAGQFQVGGQLTAYFADVAAVNAVNNNSDITLDAHFVKANSGWSLDLPLIALGDGRPNVEQDQAIKLPLDMEAATGAKVHSTLNHTALMVFWDYLPTLADS